MFRSISENEVLRNIWHRLNFERPDSLSYKSVHVKGRDRLENLGVDGRVILKWITYEILGFYFVDCINQAQDRTSGGLL
jgi:hypothetical protein